MSGQGRGRGCGSYGGGGRGQGQAPSQPHSLGRGNDHQHCPSTMHAPVQHLCSIVPLSRCNFMPPKPDLVFHTAPIAVKTTHSAFIVQLSHAKPAQDLSHITRPMAPIIEDEISDTEDESEPNDPHNVPSFVQPTKHVKPSRHSEKPIEASILAATPKLRNMSYLSDFQELNGGYVAFEGNPKGGKISDFKLPDESQVLLRVPRKNNMYNVNLKDIVPSRNLTCLFAKVTIDESNLCRFTCVFFLATKDKTSPILKTFVIGHKNQLSLKVKVIRSDNGNEFKIFDLNQFCRIKGIKREFNVPRIPQQNGIAEKKNRTFIKTARTMLADSLLPISFLAEAVNIACYVQNRAKLKGSLMKDLWLDTLLIVKPSEYLTVEPVCLRDLAFTARNQTNLSAGFQETFDTYQAGEEDNQQYMLFLVWSTGSSNPQNKQGDAAFDEKEHDAENPESAVNLSSSNSSLSGEQDDIIKKKDKGKSLVEYFTRNKELNANFKDYSEDNSNNVSAAGPTVPTTGQNYSNSTNLIIADGPLNYNTSPTHRKSLLRDAYQPPDMLKSEDIIYSDHENVGAEVDFNNLETSITEELLQFKMQKVWILVDLPYGKRAIGTKWVYINKKDERGIVVRNKARLVTQRHKQEEGIDYKDVFALVVRIEAIRLFLAYASFMGFIVYQMDVKSAFLYGTIKEEVLLELGMKPWRNLKEVGLTEGKSASTPIDTEKPLLKDLDGEEVDIHISKSMIGSLMYLTSSRPDFMFTVCVCVCFQVIPKASQLHAVKRIFRYLKGKPHLGLWYLKDLPFDLMAYSDSDYAGASLDRKSTTRGCQFLRRRLISWQCKKQTVVATSSTEAEYVAGASCCAQVLWI
nr:putative ribonuclease H-like domain-containing protein [Tanacetum cinerariifolium]